jgi:hypothetical protein
MLYLNLIRGLARALATVAVLCVGGCDDEAVELPRIDYIVGFNLEPTTGPVGALQIEVDYLGSNGAWAGNGGRLACRWIVDASLHACNDKGAGTLSCAVVDTSGFTGPTPLMECSFLSRDDALTAADFDVRVVDSSGIDLAPIDAEVTVTVDASPPVTTTTIDPDNPAPQYSVVFDLVAAARPAAALQFDITHPGLTGGWLGAGGDVDCRWLVTSNARACNDRGNGILSCAVVNSAGLDAPVSVLECGFASFDATTAEDFDVRVLDASASDLSPIDVTVLASSVTERQND